MTEKKKRDSRHYLRRFLTSIFLCFLIMAILYANLPELRKAWWQWQLNQAQKKWEQNEPAHYRYHEMVCFLRCFHTIVTVENGEVVEAEEWRFTYYADEIGEDAPELPIVEPVEDAIYLDTLTIGLRFRGIERTLNSSLLGVAPVHVEYDIHYGYPKVIVNHFCEFVGTNPITGLCEPYNSTDNIIEFEVLE